ncbi:PREDICTED: hybrid signal transduction histidine kinase M isoform X2 [Nelumbo nucifera]|nr:PREDICTED: hybrid signal transduction histidine kinase M isoform X2 [Nelumbo nucifera]
MLTLLFPAMSSLTSSTTIITALAIPVQKNLSASDNRPLSTWISVSLYYSCKIRNKCNGRIQLIGSDQIMPRVCSRPFQIRTPITHTSQKQSAAVVCSAALNARCGAEQTQTITRQSPTSTITPIQGKEKAPELDDGGTGFPPRDDGDGGGGGGGGGGGWSGGFFFFGFLAFLGFLKDQESEGPYRDDRRK